MKKNSKRTPDIKVMQGNLLKNYLVFDPRKHQLYFNYNTF